MSLANIPLIQITEADLEELIHARAPENLHLEYKQQTYGRADADRIEFLADVSSFANTSGGDILIGMSETAGIPTSVVPFLDDADAECLRLDNIARSSLEPRILNLQIRAVPIKMGGHVIVIRIPRSYVAPHRVNFGGKHKFFARGAGGKYEPSVDELRGLFNLAPKLSERVRNFRLERTAKIAVKDLPISLEGNVHLVIHVVPISTFDEPFSLDISALSEVVHSKFPPPGRLFSRDWAANFDGLVVTSRDGSSGGQVAYTQIFRSGSIEAVMQIEGGKGHIHGGNVEMDIVKSAKIYMSNLFELGIEPPYLVLASLLGVKKRRFYVPHVGRMGMDDPPSALIDRDQLHLIEAFFETVPATNSECAKVLRPALEQLANASGVASSLTFHANGEWKFT